MHGVSVQYLEQFCCKCLPLQQAHMIVIAKCICSAHISVIQVGLGDSSDSVTIVGSITIMTVIAKTYYRDSGHVVMNIAFDFVSPQHTHNYVKNHAKMARMRSILTKCCKFFCLRTLRVMYWRTKFL